MGELLRLALLLLALTASAGAQTISAAPAIVTNGFNGTISLAGVSTGWTAGTPGTPTFTVSGTGCSLSNQVISSTTAATLTLTVGTVDCIITDPSTSATTTVSNPRAVQTWHINKIGGIRFSANVPTGTCDGTANTAPVGSTPNQHCAFNDMRYMWQDGSTFSYFNIASIMLPGDTMLLHGSIADGVDWRVGFASSTGYCDPSGFPCFGFSGDPSDSVMPPPPSGSPAHLTRILGANFGACTSQTARTQVHGGYAGLFDVMDLRNTAYLDLECVDLTDYAACGQSGQSPACTGANDFSQYGIRANNQMPHFTMTDVTMHGLSVAGMLGPTADGAVFTDVWWNGNAGAGWNADDGTTGTGHLLVQNFKIEGNGCVEEYPIVDAMPYSQCTDQTAGGYGDGFGTTTTTGTTAWFIDFENGTVNYNTQDGLDMLHAQGAGSRTTVNRVLAYGNMGQQLKVGSDGGTVMTNNLVFANCAAMSFAITGFPTGFNTVLTDFCRAGDEAVIVSLHDGSTSIVAGNTIYGFRGGSTIDSFGDLGGIVCAAGSCGATSLITYADNILVGFDPLATGRFPAQYFLQDDPPGIFATNPFTNSGTIYQNNVQFQTDNACPDTGMTFAICVAPQVVDVTWHDFGTTNVTPSSGSANVVGAGVAVTGLTTDFAGVTRPNPPSIGALEFGSGSTVATPIASPVAGTYATTQTVSLSTATGGATICYTIDGSTPAAATAGTCSHGTTYSTAITVATTTTINALGTLSGATNSSIFTGLYTITPSVAAPSFLKGTIIVKGSATFK